MSSRATITLALILLAIVSIGAVTAFTISSADETCTYRNGNEPGQVTECHKTYWWDD